MTEKLLTFEEFVDRSGHTPRYDNFIYFFYPNSIFGDVFRNKEFFVKFQEYYPNLEAKLSEEIPKIRQDNLNFQELGLLERDLYIAYCFMISYGADNVSLIGVGTDSTM